VEDLIGMTFGLANLALAVWLMAKGIEEPDALSA